MPGFRSRSLNAQAVWLADDDGNAVGTGASGLTTQGASQTIDLVSNSSAAGTSAGQQVIGGDYAFSITGTPGSVQLQTLDRNGSTWTNYLAARTTNDGANTPPGATLAAFSGGSVVRAVVTGTPSGLYVSLQRIPA
jgi:hypothetical protein